MLSSVLNRPRAVSVNIVIIRTFVKIRELTVSQKQIAEKVAEPERKYEHHHDELKFLFGAIRKLMAPQAIFPKKKIGFRTEADCELAECTNS